MAGMNRSQVVTHALSHAPNLPRPERTTSPRLSVSWASSESEVHEAQALRHQVFAVEMGARLAVPKHAPAGLDIDLFDAYCEHLLVRAGGDDGEPGPVIGTYRVLTPAAAKRAGGLYSDTEFDLTRLRALRSRVAEIGRSCVHANHRSGRRGRTWQSMDAICWPAICFHRLAA